MKKKLLFITTRPPLPAYDGTRAHVLSRLDSLAVDWHIDLFIIGDEEMTAEHRAQLEEKIGGQVIIFKEAKWQRMLKAVIGWLLGRPLQVAYFSSRRAIQTLSRIKFDYQAYYCHTLRPASSWLQAIATDQDLISKTVLDFNDAISLNYQTAIKKARGWWRLIYSLEKKRLLNYELELMTKFPHSIILSRHDQNYLLQKWKEKNKKPYPGHLSMMPYSLDDHFWSYQYQAQNQNLVFIGNLHYPPNRQGLKIFLNLIWPIVKKAHPNSELLIIGRGTEKIKSWPAGVKALGWLDNPYSLMTKQALFLNPPTFGAGVSTKMVLAMALGLPIISTEAGLSGISAENNTNDFNPEENVKNYKTPDKIKDLIGLIDYDQPEIGAKKIIELLSDKEKRIDIGNHLKAAARGSYLKSKNDQALRQFLLNL